MSELGVLLGNGRYVFFKHLSSSPIPAFREAYEIASNRLNAVSVQLQGKDIQGNSANETPEMQKFDAMMKSYLNKLSAIAAAMRNNEITYIQDLITSLEHDKKGKFTKEKNALKRLSNGKISMADYTELINTLNKIKYADQQKEFAENIKTQIKNINVLQDNLNSLSKEEKNQAITSYNEKYGKYTSEYANIVTRARTIKATIGNETLTEVARVQKTNLDSLADKINKTLEYLAENEELINCIKAEYTQHMNESDFIITKSKFIDSIIDQIIEEIRNNPRQWSQTTAKKISSNIIKAFSSNKSIRDLGSNSQASKITFQKKQMNPAELLLRSLMGGRGSKSIVDILLSLENVEEIITDLIPEKADYYISQLLRIKNEMSNATNTIEKTLDKDKKGFNKNLRNDFRSSNLGQELAKTITDSGGQFDLDAIMQNQTNNFLDRIKLSLQDLNIRVKKSSLAELMASERAKKGIEQAISTKIGGSFNLKDDIMYIIRTNTVKAPTENEISNELKSVLAEVNIALDQVIDTYLETYYNREKGSKYENEQSGTTNTQKAREDYETTMKTLLKNLQEIYEKLDKDVKKQLDQYAQATHTFLGSVSVKEYSLYQNEIGFHGGTLGPTALKAMENIQNMYLKGGISTLDMSTLEFALLNCSDNAIGGSNLRTSLEQYLLGGAALMMFDEGYGEAIPYLEKMEPTIRQLMPQNLNLYQLNGAYIPASFVLETIYQNLNDFYNKEYTNCISDFKVRNKVIITNNANDKAMWYGSNIEESFQKTSENVLANINIQFIFMAGMLDIFTNLSKAFDVK